MNFENPRKYNNPDDESLPAEEKEGDAKQEVPVSDVTKVLDQRIESFENEKQFELAIRDAKDFRELYKVVQESKGIQGSQKFYTPDDLIALLNRVGNGEDPKLLTNKMGLRQKAMELQQMQKLGNELNEDPKFKLKKVLGDIDFNLSNYKFRLQSESSPSAKTELERKIADLEKRRKDIELQINSAN